MDSKMNMLVLLSHQTHRQLINFCKQLHDEKDIIFTFVITAAPRHFGEILICIENAKLQVNRVVDLFSMENGFINNAKKSSNSLVSSEELNRILISDRFLAKGFVSGTEYASCPLSKICEKESSRAISYVYNLVDYMNFLIEDCQINICYLYCIAGSTALSISILLQKKNIPVYVLGHSRISSYQTFEKSYDGLLSSIAMSDHSKVTTEGLSFADQYIHETQSFSSSPEYMNQNLKDLKDSVKPKNILREIIRLFYSLRPRSKKYLRGLYSFDCTDLKNLFKRLYLLTFRPWSDAKNLNNYYFYPLHVDPEASTLVLTPFVTNQLDLIEQIAKQIPFDCKLIVKDHFPMLGRRPSDFYKRIKRMPKVILISPFVNSKRVLAGSKGVFTITGSVVLEASILGKPSFIFGRTPFYSFKNKIFLIDDLKRINDTIVLSEEKYNADLNDVRQYIASTFDSTISVPASYLWAKTGMNEIEKINRDLVSNFLRKL